LGLRKEIKMTTDLISQREFAKRIGVDERKVRYFIGKGKLSKCVKYDEKGKPQISYAIGIEEAESVGLIKVKSTKPVKAVKPAKVESKDEPVLEFADGSNLPYNEAIRKKENYIAKLKELEFKKLEGELVVREIVFSQLFDFHKLIKNNLLAIPDRITDDLMALTDRNEFYKLLYDSIANELEFLSDVNNVNLKDD